MAFARQPRLRKDQPNHRLGRDFEAQGTGGTLLSDSRDQFIEEQLGQRDKEIQQRKVYNHRRETEARRNRQQDPDVYSRESRATEKADFRILRHT